MMNDEVEQGFISSFEKFHVEVFGFGLTSKQIGGAAGVALRRMQYFATDYHNFHSL